MPQQKSSIVLVSVAGILALSLVVGCQRPVPTTPEAAVGPPWFEDVTDAVGLRFVHAPGPVGAYFMPQIVGSGAALFDFDNDGLLDIYLVQNGGPGSRSTNRLLRQGRDGKFTDVSAGSGLDVSGYGMGVAVGDVNNDGWPDVFVTEYGRIRLFLNNGDGKTFTDVTQEAGLDNVSWATSACFVDYDRDGWLDLVFVNYVDYDPSRPCPGRGGQRDYCHPNTFSGTSPRLFRNLGRQGGAAAPHGVRFEDVTLRSGIGQVPGPGLGVACADFNGDHWPDLFLANDSQSNRLWINQRDGTFKEEAVQRGLAFDIMGQAQANMGVALGDVDGDGLFDVLVTHLTEETHTLWKQGPRGQFRDQTAAARLSAPRYRGTGFGTVLADFDHDGALDLLVTSIAGPARLYRNVAPNRGHWLTIRAIDPALKRDAYGAEITLHAGGRRWLRWINPGYSYLCSNDPRAHFGLGTAERVDRIDVVWPDGTEEAFAGQAVDQFMELRKGSGTKP